MAERRSGSASFVLRGEPFHRAGGVHGLSGLRFAALLGGFCEPAEQHKDVVVMNSCTALRWAASRVRKIWRYHGLIMMLAAIAGELVGEILGRPQAADP